ncbi:autotransporter domain-containing protein [Novosphingobium sp.]|uniref:autotransporter domain-containing protein n=1 Tax=Novosphingobium sp. TaxID=1874826 RepID=UPI0035B01BB4
MTDRSTSRFGRRAALLTSSALVLTALSQPAFAEEAPSGTPEAYGVTTSLGTPSGTPEAYGVTTTLGTPSGQPEAYTDHTITSINSLDPQILIANPGTPTTALDNGVNVTGVGQMTVDVGGGLIGLCTGTLINPRTVIFAAHCVNDEDATAYGANSGGTPISFGFSSYNLPALRAWYFSTIGGVANPDYHATNVANYLYNVNQVVYNPASLEPDAAHFLYGDVAMATLDTPAANVPFWAMLFEQLPAPSEIGASGTGYNVQIVGYGRNGTGTTGSNGGIDFRRRAAENMIGALTDLDTFENWLFGTSGSSNPQNLYWIDFDDPLRGNLGASPFDFNAFRDPARVTNGTPTEGITASGDSGGPLILQNFSKAVVLGVLSGGYTRFFNGQPANGYGTASFYQPLYLYWDWIAANNPYHYVSAKAGDGSWTDPNHWVTTLDPSYMILNGTGTDLVNGLPTTPGGGSTGTSGDFGQICFEQPGAGVCYDTATGNEFTTPGLGSPGPGNTAGVASNDAATVSIESLGTGGTGNQRFAGATLESQAAAQEAPSLPAPTLANGLPGATNFVPNNSDPVRVEGILGKYYDVTLANTGITTLSGANITIDRLTIGTAGAGLVITNTGTLTSLMNINHLAGVVTVNGTLSSVGDYSFLGGAILGSGRINAPYLTSVLGSFVPGTQTSIGTLTIGGNLVMSSGTGYYLNLGSASGSSDLLKVVANGTSTGQASVGGSLLLSPASGATVKAGNLYTILTAEGGVSGAFNTPAAISAILTPTLIYSTNAVQLKVVAGSYRNVVNSSSPVQVAFATLLDHNRASGTLPGIFTVMDLQDAPTIRSVFESWAPRTETLSTAMGTVALDSGNRLIRQRLSSLQPGNLGGTLAYYGRPNRMAANAIGSAQYGPMFAASQDSAAETAREEGKLPETMSGFLAGGYIDGDSLPMATALPYGGRDQFDGWYIAGGIESEIGDSAIIGLALSYTDLDGKTSAGGGSVKGSLTLGTLYWKSNWDRIYFDGQIAAGSYKANTTRPGNLPGTPYTLTSNTSTLAVSMESNVGAMYGSSGLQFGPKVGFRYSRFFYDKAAEVGGPTAMVFNRHDLESVQGRAGFVLEGSGKLRPSASATYVHDFSDHPATFAGAFVGGVPTVSMPFALAGQDKDWGELSAGLTYTTGRVAVSVSADTTVARDDVRNQAYRASISLKF